MKLRPFAPFDKAGDEFVAFGGIKIGTKTYCLNRHPNRGGIDRITEQAAANHRLHRGAIGNGAKSEESTSRKADCHLAAHNALANIVN